MNEKWYHTLPLDDIQSIEPVSGGDVNQAFRINTNESPYFLLIQPGREASFSMQKSRVSKRLKQRV